MKLRRTVLLVAILGCGMTEAARAQQYSVTDLGTLGGTIAVATGINSNGQVTASAPCPATTRASRSPSTPTDSRSATLPTLGRRLPWSGHRTASEISARLAVRQAKRTPSVDR